MVEIALTILFVIGLIIIYNVVLYNHEVKALRRQDEGFDLHNDVRSKAPRKESASRAKTAKIKTPDQDKPKRAYKKKKKSIKPKTND
jgi:hypothetical protein